ncbi:hypothetical protein AVEN_274068-1 [Araneus ventricosus]|uniref:Uncharacterized protein n=1 Tax=Araneus ventricosus TaxID=182803 RepID=A0A4Y2MV66_ARAVE|nr:hypothetical protein AVEN_274068-1 [Araneus ventricosus]
MITGTWVLRRFSSSRFRSYDVKDWKVAVSLATDDLEYSNRTLKGRISEIKIVVFATQSKVIMERLRDEQERERISEISVILLVQSVSTRGNSTYHMLKRFVKLSPLITQVLVNPTIKNAPRIIPGADIEFVSEILSLDEAAKDISLT